MSNFYCEHCGTAICDTPAGYVTGCVHYPLKPVRHRKTVSPPTGNQQLEIAMRRTMANLADYTGARNEG